MVKKIWQKYKHISTLGYFLFYLIFFRYLEQHVSGNFYVIHMKIDDYIPFCEYFIIPYLMWFFYVAAGVIYFFLTDVEEYKKLMIFLATGMTIFLIISAIFPNGHLLRPVFFKHHNIFTVLVQHLYATDTETNVFPSIHVFNALGIHCALCHSPKLRHRIWLKRGSFFLTVLIILATLFLKQHSVSDDLASFLMAGIIYRFVYEEKTIMVSREQKKQYV